MATHITVTDYIVTTLLIVFLLNGWTKGLLRTLLGPLSVAVSALISLFYFDLSRNLAQSILVCLVSSVLLCSAGYLFLFMIRRGVPPDSRDYIFWVSRLLGSFASLLWKGSLLLLSILLLTVIPPTVFGLKEAQENIKGSVTYNFIEYQILPRISVVKNMKEFFEVLDNPTRMRALQTTPEFQVLFQDERLQELLADPQITEAMNNREILKILFNPKVAGLLKDKDLTEKFIAFTKVMYQKR